MKIYIVEYDFMNVRCTFESAHLKTFVQKLDWIEEQSEILQHTVDVRTEER